MTNKIIQLNKGLLSASGQAAKDPMMAELKRLVVENGKLSAALFSATNDIKESLATDEKVKELVEREMRVSDGMRKALTAARSLIICMLLEAEYSATVKVIDAALAATGELPSAGDGVVGE